MEKEIEENNKQQTTKTKQKKAIDNLKTKKTIKWL